MAQDTITEVRIEGLRCIDKLRLPLTGLTVLIGENGSGKSAILEAFELLRRAATPGFLGQLNAVHGGMTALLRQGATHLTLGVKLTPGPLEYEFTITRDGDRVLVEREIMIQGPLDGEQERHWVIHRTRAIARVFDDSKQKPQDIRIATDELMLPAFGFMEPESVQRMVQALARIDVHLPFDTMPDWASREIKRASPLRGTVLHEPAEGLERFGVNLANAYSALKNDFNESHWQETMSLVKLGLGEDLESVNVRPDPGGGTIALRVKYRSLAQQLPASALSEGQLSYLAFVALFRLNLQRASLFAFDEPETHLHPALLMRVLDFFESAADARPVILATHSDRLLDGLKDPAHSVRLVSLDDQRATQVLRPDPEALQQWLKNYRGVGEIRSEGFETSIFVQPKDVP